MLQGHQERLAPLVADVIAKSNVRFTDLDRIGVTVGPGSFTGLRVGLAFAKGLGLALDIPVVGLDSLVAIAASAPREGPGLALIDARRGQAYVRRFEGTQALGPSEAVTVEGLLQDARPDWIAGPGFGLAATIWPDAKVDDRAAGDPVALARLAAEADPTAYPPEPVYLRAPDAKLPGGIDP
jgi:tRNA threonylcarbamoyladenosine biosynthesis protein TsaB